MTRDEILHLAEQVGCDWARNGTDASLPQTLADRLRHIEWSSSTPSQAQKEKRSEL